MDRFQLILLRLKAGLKQWELADRLGVSGTVVCDLERGRRLITPEIEARIRNAIKIDHPGLQTNLKAKGKWSRWHDKRNII